MVVLVVLVLLTGFVVLVVVVLVITFFPHTPKEVVFFLTCRGTEGAGMVVFLHCFPAELH